MFKGWNHVHARHLTDPAVGGIAASVLIAGDDPEAKDMVFAMARDMGFHRGRRSTESDPRPGKARGRDALPAAWTIPGLVPALIQRAPGALAVVVVLRQLTAVPLWVIICPGANSDCGCTRG